MANIHICYNQCPQAFDFVDDVSSITQYLMLHIIHCDEIFCVWISLSLGHSGSLFIQATIVIEFHHRLKTLSFNDLEKYCRDKVK